MYKPALRTWKTCVLDIIPGEKHKSVCFDFKQIIEHVIICIGLLNIFIQPTCWIRGVILKKIIIN